MPPASSPIAYPPSSSPPVAKRSLPVHASQLRKPRTVGGFLLDDSDEENDFSRAEPAPKRRLMDDLRVLQAKDSQNETLPDGPNGYRPVPAKKTVSSVLTDVEDDVRAESIVPAVRELPMLSIQAPAVSTYTVPTQNGSELLTCSGRTFNIRQRKPATAVPFEQLVAARSTAKAGRAKKSFYGINIQQLIEDAAKENKKTAAKESQPRQVIPSVETTRKFRKTLMWTEKYRARNFIELVGDDRTHRQVLRWLKSWDPIVFPKSGKPKPTKRPGEETEEKPHRKILLLTGPPGLGKTTLAHVCARQAGYEVMEINASDERSGKVVKGRIRTSVGTESVKTGATITSKTGHVQKVAHPLCVVVDEVDGVVGGAGEGGDGGFVKALIDLVQLDQKNTSGITNNSAYSKKKKKADDFRLMRPLILICNDVYHPALRALRNSSFAEIIHVRKPPLDAVVTRMKSVFEKEGVVCDSDGVRRLCEATWGISSDAKKGSEGSGEGDLRGIMVVGEWAARKLKAESKSDTPRLTRKWVEKNMTSDLSHGGGGTRGVGRGGLKEVVKRVFLEGAGFPKSSLAPPSDELNEGPKSQLGVAELSKKAGMDRLREMIDTSGDVDRIMTDIFSEYPSQPFNDDSVLSKPDAAYEWLHFHDSCSNRVFSNQEWELAPYLSQPILACHNLFSSPARHYFRGSNEPKKWGEEEEPEEVLPFSGPRADYMAFEAEKLNRVTILELQANLNAMLLRSFRSPEDIATDLLPYLVRLLTPDIKPIVVGVTGDQRGIASVRKASEKAMVKRAVDVMGGVGVVFERGRLEGDFGNRTEWVYRMDPPLDELATFETLVLPTHPPPVRYAVRQVLDQEHAKNIIVRENAARQARYRAGNVDDLVDFSFASRESREEEEQATSVTAVQRDFFGRVVSEQVISLVELDGGQRGKGKGKGRGKGDGEVWVTFHEGYSNAVRKPITVEELMRGL